MGKGNILLVADNFYPHTGGLEVFCTNVATRLAALGFKVSVLTYQYDPTLPLQQIHNDVEIYRLPAKNILPHVYSLPKLSNEHTKKTLAHLSSQKWEAVLTNTRFFTSCVLGRRIAKKTGSQFIHIEHGNSSVKHPNPLISLCAWLYDQTLGRFVMSSADLVVAISHKGEFFAKSLGAKKTAIVYNSVDTKHCIRVSDDEAEALRQEYGVENSDFVVYYVGRLIHAKGLQHLIAVIDKVPRAKLIIVGGGPYRSELEALAKGKRVDFRGPLPTAVVQKIFSIADCLVNPSYNEGIPTNILEAGSVGVPVIATDVGGTKEIIPDIRYGITIAPKDEKALLNSLLLVQKNKPLTHGMTKQLRNRVQTIFDWDVNVEKLQKIIIDLNADAKLVKKK